MSTHSSITEFFDELENFLQLAPRKLVDFFWEDFEKTIKRTFMTKNLSIENDFYSNWYDLFSFYNKGGCDMKNNTVYKEINKNYKLFNIPKDRIPSYNGHPEDFVKDFKKVTILKNEPSYYAAGSKLSICDK